DVESDILDQIARGLQIRRDAIKAAQWIDNGPGWVAVMLTSRTEILSLKPDYPVLGNLKLGVVAPWDPLRDGKDAFFEVRA
ncbi:hypothetical protein QIG99_27355, partial [Klebsiella pneumoniae]|nr:hypothetical protein [Klebsiella pneumoniae]